MLKDGGAHDGLSFQITSYICLAKKHCCQWQRDIVSKNETLQPLVTANYTKSLGMQLKNIMVTESKHNVHLRIFQGGLIIW